jgi:hypothetical protein
LHTIHRTKKLIWTGVLGILGVFAATFADIFSIYSQHAISNIRDTFSILQLKNIEGLLSAKGNIEFVVGFYVALFVLPLGVLGVYHTYLMLKPAGRLPATLFAAFGFYGYVLGTVFHAVYSFLGSVILAKRYFTSAEAYQNLLNGINTYFEPLAVILAILTGAAATLLIYLILSGKTVYPKWFVAFSPLVVFAALVMFTGLFPDNIRVYLAVASANITFVIFFSASTLLALRLPEENKPQINKN